MNTMPTTPESNDANDGDDMSPLLSEPFARAWAAPAAGLPGRLGERLGERLARSLQAEQGMVTVRRRKAEALPLADGALQEKPVRIRIVGLEESTRLLNSEIVAAYKYR